MKKMESLVKQVTEHYRRCPETGKPMTGNYRFRYESVSIVMQERGFRLDYTNRHDSVRPDKCVSCWRQNVKGGLGCLAVHFDFAFDEQLRQYFVEKLSFGNVERKAA